MNRRLSILFAFAALFLFARPASATIHYRISLSNPAQHIFQVSMDVPAAGGELIVALPAWNALYQIRDFAYRVRDVQAEIPGTTPDAILHPEKIDKQTWRIALPAGSTSSAPTGVRITYSIVWDDPGPFDSQLNTSHAFLNFAEVLMYVPDRRAEPCEVALENIPSGWRAIAELPAGPDAVSFDAASYDALVDAPAELGNFKERDFDESGTHFRVVLDAGNFDFAALTHNLQRITSSEVRMMGGPPFREYTFFFHIGDYPDVGGGGMEHANGTAIAASSLEEATDIAAHEFFHAWNVKRIRPQSLAPVDYTKEQYTRALWFAEGVTSTYASYTLERTGLWSRQRFYADLARQIADLQSLPARHWQSVEESSLDAWLEKYTAYRVPARSISYYNKGQIDGVLLDLAIRSATQNRKSLDDVLRLMNREYAEQGKFYDDSNGVRAAAEQVAGKSFEDFFRRYVSGTDEIPYQDFLSLAGLDLQIAKQVTPTLGFWPGGAFGGRESSVATIEPGSAAESAGIMPGDDILALDGKPFPANFTTWLSARTPGETVKLLVRRDGRELNFSIPVASREDDRYSIAEAPHPTGIQRRIREGILRGSTD